MKYNNLRETFRKGTGTNKKNKQIKKKLKFFFYQIETNDNSKVAEH